MYVQFMQQQFLEMGYKSDNDHTENVCWLVPTQPFRNPSRYKSPFSTKVRWDCWMEKKGCCKTIGPPPRVCVNCPEQFLRKHSRQVPVFFTPEEVRVCRTRRPSKSIEYQEILSARRYPLGSDKFDTRTFSKQRRSHQDETCPFPPIPSRLGLFRNPREPSYEQQYRINKPISCFCDNLSWNELLRDYTTECADKMAARSNQSESRNYGEQDNYPTKDFIRSNAVHAIRMPPRRLRRCYVNQCDGVHLVDMGNCPYVLRPGYGKVPPYIYRRKMELLQRDFQAKKNVELTEQNDISEGMQVVSDMEKEMVIQGLKDYSRSLLFQYNSLPLNNEGERLRELRQSLEERLKEVEQDLRLLTSSNTLFVGDVKESHFL